MPEPGLSPILEITDGLGNLVPEAPFRILATMFHPDNDEARAGIHRNYEREKPERDTGLDPEEAL